MITTCVLVAIGFLSVGGNGVEPEMNRDQIAFLERLTPGVVRTQWGEISIASEPDAKTIDVRVVDLCPVALRDTFRPEKVWRHHILRVGGYVWYLDEYEYAKFEELRWTRFAGLDWSAAETNDVFPAFILVFCALIISIFVMLVVCRPSELPLKPSHESIKNVFEWMTFASVLGIMLAVRSWEPGSRSKDMLIVSLIAFSFFIIPLAALWIKSAVAKDENDCIEKQPPAGLPA